MTPPVGGGGGGGGAVLGGSQPRPSPSPSRSWGSAPVTRKLVRPATSADAQVRSGGGGGRQKYEAATRTTLLSLRAYSFESENPSIPWPRLACPVSRTPVQKAAPPASGARPRTLRYTRSTKAPLLS